MFRSKTQKLFSVIVFALYFALLVWLVLFKLHINIWEVHHARTVNLLPFRLDPSASLSLQLQEMLYNVLAFVPLGVYVNLYKPDWTFWKRVLPCFAVSFLFETIQFVFALGVSDITDLITNTLGGIIGILLFLLAQKLFRQKSISIINIFGLASEGSAILLFAILLNANR